MKNDKISKKSFIVYLSLSFILMVGAFFLIRSVGEIGFEQLKQDHDRLLVESEETERKHKAALITIDMLANDIERKSKVNRDLMAQITRLDRNINVYEAKLAEKEKKVLQLSEKIKDFETCLDSNKELKALYFESKKLISKKNVAIAGYKKFNENSERIIGKQEKVIGNLKVVYQETVDELVRYQNLAKKYRSEGQKTTKLKKTMNFVFKTAVLANIVYIIVVAAKALGR